MKEYRICDYIDTDYKKEFWDSDNRLYEDFVERIALRKLLRGLNGNALDVGAGYGRLANELSPVFDKVYLFDHAYNLIEQAKRNIRENNLNNVDCIQGNLYEIEEVVNYRFDCITSIRVIHHVEQVPIFFRKINKVLKKEGYFILEFANKRNILEILRAILGCSNMKPFVLEPTQRGNSVYYNFHPKYIKKCLIDAGFSIEEILCVSFFRNEFIKKMVSYKVLGEIDRILQKPLGFTELTPSVFIKAKKVFDV